MSRLAKKRVRVYVVRSMVVECDEFQEYFLDDEGKLEITQEYGESLIDVELSNQALPANSGLDTLTFHWFHPSQWFEHLKINQDISHWKLQEKEKRW